MIFFQKLIVRFLFTLHKKDLFLQIFDAQTATTIVLLLFVFNLLRTLEVFEKLLVHRFFKEKYQELRLQYLNKHSNNNFLNLSTRELVYRGAFRSYIRFFQCQLERNILHFFCKQIKPRNKTAMYSIFCGF